MPVARRPAPLTRASLPKLATRAQEMKRRLARRTDRDPAKGIKPVTRAAAVTRPVRPKNAA